MKQFKIFFTIVTIAAVFTACQKNFLERRPLSLISESDYWNTENDLRLYANSFYNTFPSYIGGFGTLGPFSADDNSDNMITREYNRTLNGERTIPASDGGWTYGTWADIRRVNYFLGNYHKATGTDAIIKKYLGEALFFKAWYYFSRLKMFGDLPWISSSITESDSTVLYAPRLSRAVVVDSMMSILDKAIEYLPAKSGAQYENYRIYKELAAAFQSRVALYEGTWEKYHAGTVFGVQGSNGSKLLEKAASAAQLAISSGKFDLDNVAQPNGYWKLFNQLNYDASKEVMLWRKYNAADGIYTIIARTMTAGAARGITKSFIDDYLCVDGKPISVSPLYQGDATLVSVSTNRDPRFTQSVQINDGDHYLSDTAKFSHPAWDGAAEDKNYTGYQIYKGLILDPNQKLVGQGTQGIIYFRYAEVLLNYIEAKAELGQATQADVDMTINKLRARIGMPNLVIASIVTDPKWLFPTLSPLINEVRRERRVELGLEGFRLDDVYRWAAAGSLIKGWKPKGAKRAQFENWVEGGQNKDAVVKGLYPIDEQGYIFPYKNNVVGASGYNFNIGRDYLSPLPTDQLVLNKKLKQNPGWE